MTVGWLEVSPAEQLTAKAVAGPAPAARSRVLSDDEIKLVMTTDIAAGPVTSRRERAVATAMLRHQLSHVERRPRAVDRPDTDAPTAEDQHQQP